MSVDHAARATSRNLAAMAFGLAIAALGAFHQFKLPVVLPVLLERYAYDRVVAGGFMSIFALAGLLLSVRVGRAIERRGAAGLTLQALAALMLGSALTLAAPEHQLVVLAGRALEGLAFTILAIVGPVLATANAPPRQLLLVIGVMATWIPLGQLIATSIATISLATVGWQALWWVGLAATGLFGWWALQLSRTGALRTAATYREAEPRPRLAAPALPSARPILALATGLFVLWSAQYIAFMTWLPQYLVEALGLPLDRALRGYVLCVALVMSFNVLAGVAMRAGVGIGLILMAGLLTQLLPWWLLVATKGQSAGLVVLILYGAGAGLVPTCLLAVPSAVGRLGADTATAFGYVMTGRNLGVLTGPVLLAQIVESSGRWDAVGPVFGALMVAGVVLGTALAARLRHARSAPVTDR
jgi:MFS family permease